MNGICFKGKDGRIKFAMSQIFLAFALLGAQILTVGASSKERDAEEIGYRLPTSITPSVYRLDLLTNLADMNENFTFQGRVCIQVICNNATDKIILHSKNLHIHESEVSVRALSADPETTIKLQNDGSPHKSYFKSGFCDGQFQKDSTSYLKILNHCYHDDYELYIIHLSEPLKKGFQYTIHISYEGLLKTDLAGYYRSSYKDLNSGSLKWMTVTQFESTDARRAFPCFDEPIFKARFQVNLGHIKTKTSISNMRQMTSSPIQGMENWVWDHYEMTVPMSTYLLAFIVSEFEYKAAPDIGNNVLFRVWARKDAIDQVDYAAYVGPRVLAYYEKYFDIKYPLPKQDMIAIPDFSSGAMENWGLITYREVALLYDPKVSTASSQPFIASVIAHELAHQWFGNLVTMKWWTDLWLNEGFATYVAGLGVHHLYPEWNVLDEEASENMAHVFSLDSLKSSHPISVPIGHPKEIPQIFDAISYKKGSFAIRMMNLFLGEDTFRKGITNYLRKHAYGNAEQDDLWKILSEVAHESEALNPDLTVKEIMDTWTLQVGYPVVTVIRNYEDGTATASQKRFLADKSSDRENSKWWIPISYTTQSECNFNRTRPRVWLSKTQSQVTISGLPNQDWLILNIQIAGIYRVNYDDENWMKLTKALSQNHKDIALLNRILLIDDAFALAKAGELDYSIAFNVIDYFKNEREYLPWKALLRNLGHIDKMLRFSGSYDMYRSYMTKLLEPIYKFFENAEFDEKPEHLEQLKHQKLILSWACKYGVGNCKSKAIADFKKWMEQSDPDNNNPIPKDSRSYIYCTAIKYGDENEWKFLWKRYLNSNVGSEGNLILSALGCTREVWLLNRYLEWSLTKIRRQDSASVFSVIARGDIGYFLAKTFFRNRIGDIYKAFGSKTNKLGTFVNALSAQMTTASELEEFTKFINDNDEYLTNAQQSIKQSLENAKINIQWHDEHYNNVMSILEKHAPKKD